MLVVIWPNESNLDLSVNVAGKSLGVPLKGQKTLVMYCNCSLDNLLSNFVLMKY